MFGVTKTSLEKRFYGHMSTVNTMKTKTPLGDTITKISNRTNNDDVLRGNLSINQT